MPKIKMTVPVVSEGAPRKDSKGRRKRPRGNADMGTGYRVNPETNMPEWWCSNCETYKHVTLFRKVSTPRSRRVCNECEERLTKRSDPVHGILRYVRPYGGEDEFAREVWHYMKGTICPPVGRGNWAKGKKGKPRTRLVRGRAIKRVLGGQKELPGHYPALLQKAILDPDNRVHFKSRLWLVFRQGVLNDQQLRMCGCTLADRLMDDVTAHTQDDIFFGLGSVIDDMRALAMGKAYYSRQRLENMRSRVSALETELDKREARKEFDHTVRRVFFVLTALLSGSALIALYTIANDYVEHFQFRLGSRDLAMQDMLARACDVLDADAEYRERKALVIQEDENAGRPDPLTGTYWQEYDHHSTTRFLLITDVHKHVVQLRVVSNEDTPEEVGEYINAMRTQFEGMGPGFFIQLFPEDIRDSGVSIGKMNRCLTSWGLAPLRTEIDDARERLEEIESEEIAKVAPGGAATDTN